MNHKGDHDFSFPRSVLANGLSRTPGRPARQYESQALTPKKYPATPLSVTPLKDIRDEDESCPDRDVLWDDDMYTDYLASLSILDNSSTTTSTSNGSPGSLSMHQSAPQEESSYIRQSLLSLDPQPSGSVRPTPSHPLPSRLATETPGFTYVNAIHQTDTRCLIKTDPRYRRVRKSIRDIPKFFDEQVGLYQWQT